MNEGYAICLNEWALDKDIKNELGLLLIISSLTAEKGYCYASNKYLASIFETTEETISRKIKTLQEKNYITVEYEKKGCEIINRKLRLTKISIVDYQKYQSSIDKNVKENNIMINNISINREIYIEEIEKWKPILTPTDFEIINKIIENFTIEQVREAIPICEYNNAYSLKYLIQVLTNPRKEKINVAKKSGINPKWLNEDIESHDLSDEEIEKLKEDLKDYL